MPRSSHRRLLRHVLLVAGLGLFASCEANCDEFGPTVQVSVIGDVRLNGTAVPNAVVEALAFQATTNANGSYNLRVQSNTEPLPVCVTIVTEPYRTATPALATSLGCSSLINGESFRYDFDFASAPAVHITAPPAGVQVASTTTLELAATAFTGVTLNGTSAATISDAVDWSSTLQGSLGQSTLLNRLQTQLAPGTHLLIATHTNALGDIAADTIAVYVDTSPPSGSGRIGGTVRFGGEPLVGIRVALSGTAADNTTTDTQGGYSFSGLAAGDYTVLITPPPGIEMVRAKSVTLADGQSATVDFGS